jgi:hypothetical protein
MAYFVILTSDANLVESFDDESEALAALEEIGRQDPEHADQYALFRYDDDGRLVGAPTPGSTTRLHA